MAAALLHDTGHPPFSHAVEKELGVSHEDVTVHLLRSDTEVHRILIKYGGDALVEAVAGHIDGTVDAPTVDLIHSQLDADRLDYVLRDGYYAGVPNSQYDLERIVQMVQRDDNGLCFDRRAQYAIEGYFTARYHLYLQLYYHKTVRAGEALLRSAIRRAGTIAKSGAEMGSINPALLNLLVEGRAEASVLVSDADLWAAFAVWAESSGDTILKDLSRRLLNRELFRAIDIDVKTFPKLAHKLLPVAQDISRAAGLDPDYYVVVDTYGDTPYKFADYDVVESVRIVDSHERSIRLETLSGLVTALQSEAYNNIRCCLPFEIREKVLNAWKTL
jgi:HD superfamily phosphohydrolase